MFGFNLLNLLAYIASKKMKHKFLDYFLYLLKYKDSSLLLARLRTSEIISLYGQIVAVLRCWVLACVRC